MPEFAGSRASYIGQGTAQKPIRPGSPPGEALIELTLRTMKRFTHSRDRILQCRAVRRGEKTIELNPDWLTSNKQASEWVTQILPERTMIPLNLVNLLSAERPRNTRHPRSPSSDRAVHQADEFEAWINALARRMIDWPELIGKAVEDGEFGVVVTPSAAVLDYAPDYMTSIGRDDIRKPDPRYDRDERGRRPGHPAYGARSERSSIAAWREDLNEYFASNPPFVVRIIPATDCAPILVRGRDKRRWECRGLVTRTLFDREELISRKFRWEGMGDREMIPRGFDAQNYGSEGQLYLYEAFLTDVDHETGEETPFIARSVGGRETWTVRADGEHESATIDLKAEYGLNKLMVGYYWGLRHADDDPDFRGIPVLWPLLQTILRLEGLSTAAAVQIEKNAFTGHVAVPDPNIPKEAYLDSDMNFETFSKPGPDEIKIVPGQIQPWAQAQVGPDVWRLLAQERAILAINTPDESQTGGKTDASGHAMVVSHELLESAKRQIKDGCREAYEDISEWLTALACGLARGYWKAMGGTTVALPVYEDIERTVESTGAKMTTTEAVEFKESWVGNNYNLTAEFPRVGNLAERQQSIDAWQKGAMTFDEMREAFGDESPETTRRKIARDAVIQSEFGQILYQIEVMRERKMRAQRQFLEAQLAGLITKMGIPIDALAPELLEELGATGQGMVQGAPQGLPQGMPGGPAPMPAMQAPNMGQNVLGGVVSGEMGSAARQADALAQTTVNPGGV